MVVLDSRTCTGEGEQNVISWRTHTHSQRTPATHPRLSKQTHTLFLQIEHSHKHTTFPSQLLQQHHARKENTPNSKGRDRLGGAGHAMSPPTQIPLLQGGKGRGRRTTRRRMRHGIQISRRNSRLLRTVRIQFFLRGVGGEENSESYINHACTRPQRAARGKRTSEPPLTC